MSASYLFSQSANTIDPKFLPANAVQTLAEVLTEGNNAGGQNILGVNRVAFGAGAQYISSISNQLILNDSGAPNDCVVGISNGGGGGDQPPFARVYDEFYNNPYKVNFVDTQDVPYIEYGGVTCVKCTDSVNNNVILDEQYAKFNLMFGIIVDKDTTEAFDVSYTEVPGAEMPVIQNISFPATPTSTITWCLRFGTEIIKLN
jgi:hypothetical protein